MGHLSCWAAAARQQDRLPAGGHMAAVVAQVAGTRAGARQLLRRQLPRWLRPGLAGYVPVDGRPRPARDPDAYAELLCRIHPVGTARRLRPDHDRHHAAHRHPAPDLHGRGRRGPGRRAGEHRPARRRGAALAARAPQQSTSSGRWLRICARALVNAAYSSRACGRNTAARWQFWNASRTP